jgi:Flp pilus assembly secretin CpaC
LGGLTEETDTETESKVPILGDIPILGYLFKSTVKSKAKSNLAILVHPTIIEPKLRAGQNKYTQDRINIEKQRLESESVFSAQKDPVARMFFGSMGKGDSQGVDDYLKEAHYGEEHTEGIYQPAELTGAALQDTVTERMTATVT